MLPFLSTRLGSAPCCTAGAPPLPSACACSVQAYVAAFLQRDDGELLSDDDVEEVVLEDEGSGSSGGDEASTADPARLLHQVGTFAQVRHFQEANHQHHKAAFVLLYGHRRLRRLRTVRPSHPRHAQPLIPRVREGGTAN